MDTPEKAAGNLPPKDKRAVSPFRCPICKTRMHDSLRPWHMATVHLWTRKPR